MINFPYHLSILQGRLYRKIYKSFLNYIAARPINQAECLNVDIYFFSGKRDLTEQVASIRSFVRWVGLPSKIIVFSDGSHDEKDKKILKSIPANIEIVPWYQLVNKDLPDRIMEYASKYPLGKKLAVILSLKIDKPTIYSDSDILFFRGSEDIRKILNGEEKVPYFLQDGEYSLYEDLLRNEDEKKNPVNSGFILFTDALKTSKGIERITATQGDFNYFAEQTTLHLILHDNFAKPLEKDKFVVCRKDQMSFSDCHNYKEICLRHFVGPIRHKFWTNILK